MSFQSLGFLLFLAVTVTACLTAAKHSRPMAQRMLLVAGVIFYLIGGGWQAILVLAAGLTVTAAVLRQMEGSGNRKRVLTLGCLWHIGVLMAFKYTGFFTGGRWAIGWAPLGLSFFTFQQLWLMKEAYDRPIRLSEEELALFGLFFPTVTSGPILRPNAFFPQLEGEKFLNPDGDDIAAGLYAVCLGTAKKVLLADPLGIVVSNGWAQAGELTAPAAWLVILAYTLQLYLDFSGYCDIAAGTARLLGIRLPVNFDSPYRSRSVTEFWKRWHITLTTFLRECLYFPLGGSKKGTARTYLNILIVFLVSGFWHGAGWTFLVWGGLHGLAQIAERLWGARRDRLPKAVQWAVTFLFVNLAWVFFRAPGLSAAFELLKAAVTMGGEAGVSALTADLFASELTAAQTLLPAMAKHLPLAALVVLLAVSLLVSLWPKNTIRQMDAFKPTVWNLLACGVLMLWSTLAFSQVATFIYSNF